MATRVVLAVVVGSTLITLAIIFWENLGLREYISLERLGFDCERERARAGQEGVVSVSVGGDGSMGAGTATSGKLFSGSKVASYDMTKLRFASFGDRDHLRSSVRSPRSESFEAHPLKCSHWSVVTTIFEPSEAVKRQAHLKDWCLVVVGDRKGPKDYPLDAPAGNVVFLTAAQQEQLASHFPLVQALPWNHFGRKNVGFLYAILHGARFVWDFDDDNMLLSSTPRLDIPGNPWIQPTNSNGSAPDLQADSWGFGLSFKVLDVKRRHTLSSFNPYPLMGAPMLPCWPRGLPLEHIKEPGPNSTDLAVRQIPTAAVGVVQSLAQHDPDIDAIFRLTMPIPFDFAATSPALPLLVPEGTYAPYNAQATLHLYSSLWSLLLPVTVHGRVSDIWRGYITQRLGRDIGMKLVFSPPIVRQDRNTHNYLADFDSEGPLYKRASKLIHQIDKEWQPKGSSLVARIEELWVFLYEHGYFEKEDVVLVQAWLQSLIDAGYDFPRLVIKR